MTDTKPTVSERSYPRLQSRYLVFAGLLSLIIGFSIYFSYSTVSDHYESLLEHTRQSSEIRHEILQMRNHINSLVSGIDLVMLQPEYRDQVDLIFQASFTEIEQIIERVKTNIANIDAVFINELDDLSHNLQLYKMSARKLIDTRTNASVQYPAMEVSMRVMRPARIAIMSLLNTALNEYREEPPFPANHDYFQDLMALKLLWTSTVAEYRLYLANRVGSFDEQQLLEQEINVDDYLQEFAAAVERLAVHRRSFGFQSVDLVRRLQENLKNWRSGFDDVKEINHSGEWRRDTEIMRVEILPLSEAISLNLINIGRYLQNSSSELVEDFGQIGQQQAVHLVVIALIFVVYSVLVFVFLRVLMFRPLSILVASIRDDMNIDSGHLRGIGKTREIKTLIDSFLAMHGKVIRRQQELSHQALHDALTSLPNRKLLLERLQHDMDICHRQESQLAFLMLDLNGFKYVNDTLGHHVGDQLLIQVGRRLRELLREVDTIARLGGDEFSIILPGVQPDDAIVVANKINTALEKPFSVDDCVLNVGTSIGITVYPDHGRNVSELMKHADVAMYRSKQQKLPYHCYQIGDDDTVQRLSLSNDLKDALAANQLELNFQPKQSFQDNRIVGFEVLLRWRHPELGYISPEQVVEIAENAGMIDNLTMNILGNALHQQLELDQQFKATSVAINLSVHNLRNDSFFENVRNLIGDVGIEPSRIIFEVTESSMMADPEKSIGMLQALSDIGVKISVDDYGTGFSSLAYLKRLPVNELKIDSSFVRDMVRDANDRVIVQSTIELGHNLGLSVIAEGVEDAESRELLRGMGCDSYQGYFLSKPMKFATLKKWLKNHH